MGGGGGCWQWDSLVGIVSSASSWVVGGGVCGSPVGWWNMLGAIDCVLNSSPKGTRSTIGLWVVVVLYCARGGGGGGVTSTGLGGGLIWTSSPQSSDRRGYLSLLFFPDEDGLELSSPTLLLTIILV